MITYVVDLAERSYPIHIGSGALSMLGAELQRLKATRALIVTNTTVGPLYAQKAAASVAQTEIPFSVCELPDGEEFKDLGHLNQILTAAAEAGLDRHSVIVALGGGVAGDMAGFAAAIWMRGIRFIQVPTTLLAQVDSSVGGKTGVNVPAGKNLIGAFHQPGSVLIDTDVLKTLPERQISAGIAEIIKYGFLGDETFVETLEKVMPALRALDTDVVSEVVARCCRMKAEIVHEDERESGVRAKLNLGHTFGHAVEKLSGYGHWLHGEDAGTGIVMAAVLSEELGNIGPADVERVRKLVAASGLPVEIPGISQEAAYKAMQGDKKSLAGVIRFVVMNRIGDTQIQTVQPELVFKTMKRCGWV